MSNLLKGPSVFTAIPRDVSIGRITRDRLEGLNQNLTIMIDLKSGLEYTIGQILEFSENLAAQLRNLGARKDDILALVSENTPKYYVVLLACFYLGTPVHLLNPGFTKYEFKKILDLTKPKIVFSSSKTMKTLKEIQNEESWIEVIISMDEELDRFFDKMAKNFKMEENLDPSDQTAVICNSSGTTGHPKGVMVTHSNLTAAYIHASDPRQYQFNTHEITNLVVPTYHIYGLGILLSCAFMGKTTVLIDKFEPRSFIESIENFKVTKLFLVPLLANFLADTNLIDEFDVSSVYDVFCTSAPPSAATLKKLTTRFANVKTVRQLYGMTEFPWGICATPLDSHRNDSCGMPIPGVEIKIADRQGAALGVTEIGEICVRGDFFKGYVNQPEKNREILDSDGFLRTGDVGYYDHNRFVFIIDRFKDLIKYKSYQVAPAEIEDLIKTLPGVDEVAVVGKPDARFGELPVAFVVKNPQIEVRPQEIQNLIEKFLSIEKHLHGGVIFVKEIPKNHIGKILRKKLRDTFQNS